MNQKYKPRHSHSGNYFIDLINGSILYNTEVARYFDEQNNDENGINIPYQIW